MSTPRRTGQESTTFGMEETPPTTRVLNADELRRIGALCRGGAGETPELGRKTLLLSPAELQRAALLALSRVSN